MAEPQQDTEDKIFNGVVNMERKALEKEEALESPEVLKAVQPVFDNANAATAKSSQIIAQMNQSNPDAAKRLIQGGGVDEKLVAPAQQQANQATELASRLVSGGGGVFGPDPQQQAQLQSQLQAVQSQRADLTGQLQPKDTEKSFLDVFIQSLLPVALAGAFEGRKGLAASAEPFARQQAQFAKEDEVNQKRQDDFAKAQLSVLADQEAAIAKQIEESAKFPTNRFELLARMEERGVVPKGTLVGAAVRGSAPNISINNIPLGQSGGGDEAALLFREAFKAQGVPGSMIPSIEKLSKMSSKEAMGLLEVAKQAKVSDKARNDAANAARTGAMGQQLSALWRANKGKEGETGATQQLFKNIADTALSLAPALVPGEFITGGKVKDMNAADAARFYKQSIDSVSLSMASDSLAGVVTEPDKEAFANLWPSWGSSEQVGTAQLDRLDKMRQLGGKIKANIANVSPEEFSEWTNLVSSMMPPSEANLAINQKRQEFEAAQSGGFQSAPSTTSNLDKVRSMTGL